jgi:putative membrane protein
MMGVTVSWMWVWPVLVVVGLLVVGYVGVRLALGRQGAPPTGSDPASGLAARRILDERYARGDIDTEEYQRRRDLLP